MCCLCLVSERSFLRDPQPFLKKEKKKSKKVKKFQSGIFGLFWTDMASRLLGIANTNISRYPSQKKTQKISKMWVQRVKDSWFDPLNLSGWAMPNWPQRGANQKFGSDNDVWSQKLNFFTVKNPLQIQFENFSRVICWIWMDYGYNRCPIWNFLLISDGAWYGQYPSARNVALPSL